MTQHEKRKLDKKMLSKECVICTLVFYKSYYKSLKNWCDTKCCSLKCKNILVSRLLKGGNSSSFTVEQFKDKTKHPRWIDGRSGTIEYVRFCARQRRYLQKNAVGSHTLAEWEAVKEFYAHMCLCCKQQEPFIKLTEDHIIPLSLGGNNDIENIQPLCHSCNSRKHTKSTDYREKMAFANGIMLI